MSPAVTLELRDNGDFDGTMRVVDAAGAPLDVTGWDFSAAFHLAGEADVVLELQTVGVAVEGFRVLSAVAGLVEVRIDAETLQDVPDSTGRFVLEGDLLVVLPGDRKRSAPLNLDVVRGVTYL